LLGNTSFRNYPRRDSDDEVQYTLSILNKCGRPSGSSKDHWLADKEYRSTHVHILINYVEDEFPYQADESPADLPAITIEQL